MIPGLCANVNYLNQSDGNVEQRKVASLQDTDKANPKMLLQAHPRRTRLDPPESTTGLSLRLERG